MKVFSIPLWLAGAALLAATTALGQSPVRAPAAGSGTAVETPTSTEAPQYLRINVRGYNIRRTPDFRPDFTENVDFRTTHGAIFAVRRTVTMRSGVAVNILVNGQDRWVYVPNWRRHEFQFCESETCMTDLTEVLRVLERQNISPVALAECGIALNSDGSIMQHHLPRTVNDVPLPTPRPLPQARALEERLPRETRELSSARLTTAPLWEGARPDVGSRWTSLLLESLQNHGQGLLSRTSFEDQRQWCPNYSRLTAAQRQEFWVHLLNGVARYESNFNTQTTFDESAFRNVRRGPVKPYTYSQGLFQLSYGSANQRAYSNFCRFQYAADRGKDISDPSLSIYDPKKQMDCAVGILNYWVERDGRVGLNREGGGRFWSTLRSSNPASSRIRQSLRRFTACF